MMERVEVTIPICTQAGVFGLVLMQVCAVKDATDEEILEVCNRENPSGTILGWATVIRKEQAGNMWHTKNKLPVPCEQHADRLHFLVLC